ncbi:MAG: NAD-dependent epimerase/dehydratase family protein [Burkholderiales bacterium]|nr:NAD-dependent epimerase/dehydratase family protein [Burkholderiales bacterium]
MPDVLVAGGCGFIGSHLVRRLLQRSDLARLVVVDNLWTGREGNLSDIADERLEIRVSDAETFSDSSKFDEILHLASPASPAWYMADPIRTIRANVLGGLNLLQLLKPGGRFCFTSTSEVYGDPLVSPQPEHYRGSVDCTGPRSSYDEGKRCVESMLFESRRVSGTNIRVARLFNVFGPYTRADDGRAISNFLNQALTTGVLTVYGDGLQTRSWGYVDDIVDALERYFWLDAIDYPGPLNIGNDREVSVLEVAEYICSIVPGCRIEFAAPVPQDPTNRRPDLSLARSVLPGWIARTGYEEGVTLTLEWFQTQRGQSLQDPLLKRPGTAALVGQDARAT